MLPQWRDELGIFIGPHKLALTRTARGVKPKPAGVAGWNNERTDDSGWAAALAALDALLVLPQWQGAVARVVLSDHWVRYAMVPFAAELSGDAERLAHARQVMRGIYGDIVDHWTVTLADSRPGIPQIACGLPTILLDDLNITLARHQVRLVSLQPQLVSAYNHWRDRLPDGVAWFVTVEQGSLSAVRLMNRTWDRVHSVRIGVHWEVELRRLRTFGRLASQSGSEGCVYVDAPVGLRAAADAPASDLVWLEELESVETTAGKLEFLRRQQA